MNLIRKIALSLLLLTAIVSAHFFGFLRNMPEGIQRLVVSSFALDFSGTFAYYLALALLGARMGTYAFIGMISLPKMLLLRFRAKSSWQGMFIYVRAAKSTRPMLDWIVLGLSPIL